MQGYVLLGLSRDRLCFQCRVAPVTPIWPPLLSLALDEQVRKHAKSERGASMQSTYHLIDTSIQPRLFKGNALAWPCSVRGYCYIETDNSSESLAKSKKHCGKCCLCGTVFTNVTRCKWHELKRNRVLFNSRRLYLWTLPHQIDLNMSLWEKYSFSNTLVILWRYTIYIDGFKTFFLSDVF